MNGGNRFAERMEVIMRKNKKIRRKAAGAAALGLSAAMCAVPVNAAAGTVCKDETVYVRADASGNQTEVTVSDWLKGTGDAGSLEDVSILDGITNVKGEETFTEDGERLTWNTEGKDIFYQGTTDRELPVSVKLTYYLDGVETGPEEIIGKSGHLEIRVEYENKTQRQVSVNGKTEEMCSPILMITGMILPEDTFSNVEIDNGRVINDGSRNIVLGFAMPGMRENLGMEEQDSEEDKAVIPESLVISADVEGFSMGATYTAGLTDIMDEIDTEEIVDFDTLKDAMDDLESAALQLVSGSEELAEGIGTLGENYGEFSGGLVTLNEGIAALDDGAAELAEGIRRYTAGADALGEGIGQYLGEDGALSELSDGLLQVQDAVNMLNDRVDGEGSASEDILSASEELSAGCSKLSQALNSESVKELSSRMEALTETGAEMLADAEGMSAQLQEEIAGPVSDMSAVLTEVSGYLDSLCGQIDALEEECIRQTDGINQVTAQNNEKIREARNTADAASEQLRGSAERLRQEAAALEAAGLSDEAAEIRRSADSLEQAKGAAETLKSLEELKNVESPSLSGIDTSGLEAALESLKTDMNRFGTAAEQLPQQIEKMHAGMEQLRTSAAQLPAEDLEAIGARVEELDQGMQRLEAALKEFSGGIGQLKDSADAFTEVSGELDLLGSRMTEGASELVSESSSLRDGADSLRSGTIRLLEGGNTLRSADSQVKDGITRLAEGAQELAGGMEEFEKNGTGKLTDTVENEVEYVVERLKVLAGDACRYDTFSGKSDDMEGNVRFVIATEKIEKEQ